MLRVCCEFWLARIISVTVSCKVDFLTRRFRGVTLPQVFIIESACQKT